MDVQNGHSMNRTRGVPIVGTSPRRLTAMPWVPSAYDELGRYGVRGRGMLLCALIWGLFAASAVIPLTNPAPPGLMHLNVPESILRALGWPLWLGDLSRCVIWAVPAVYALVTANHPRRSSRALGMLYVPAIGYAISYVASFVLWLIDVVQNAIGWAPFGHLDGYFRGLITAAFYAALCGLIRIIARIPAQADPPLIGPPLIPSGGDTGPTTEDGK